MLGCRAPSASCKVCALVPKSVARQLCAGASSCRLSANDPMRSNKLEPRNGRAHGATGLLDVSRIPRHISPAIGYRWPLLVASAVLCVGPRSHLGEPRRRHEMHSQARSVAPATNGHRQGQLLRLFRVVGAPRADRGESERRQGSAELATSRRAASLRRFQVCSNTRLALAGL